MFEASDRSTVVVSEKIMEDVYVIGGTSTVQKHLPAHLISIFPNPSASGVMHMRVEGGVRVQRVRVFDSLGNVVWVSKGLPESISLPGKGVFFVEVQTQKGVWTEKVIGE